MTTKRQFVVSGLEPAHSKGANDLLRAFDLGIDGAFVPFSHMLTATLREDVTTDQYQRQADGIKGAYEKLGCTNVTVHPLENDT